MKTLRMLVPALLLALAACAPSEPAMVWWNVDDLRKSGFTDALNAAPAGARLEYRFDSELLFIVTPDGAASALRADSTGFNFSHTCPPECPEGEG